MSRRHYIPLGRHRENNNLLCVSESDSPAWSCLDHPMKIPRRHLNESRTSSRRFHRRFAMTARTKNKIKEAYGLTCCFTMESTGHTTGTPTTDTTIRKPGIFQILSPENLTTIRACGCISCSQWAYQITWCWCSCGARDCRHLAWSYDDWSY